MEFNVLTDHDSLKEVVVLQKMVWGEEAITSHPHFIASITHGGVVIGAYDQCKLTGFCYGFPGFKNGRSYLCSHMMAIHPDYRDAGIGNHLKWKQREWAIANGYDKIVWTFDPLETRNAYLNLVKLGGYSKTYIESFYGEMNDNLNRGLPSDRLLIEWDIGSDRVLKAIEGMVASDPNGYSYPRLLDWEMNGTYPKPIIRESNLESDGYLLAVPSNIHIMKQEEIDLAKEWRYALRQQFQLGLSKGFTVTGLIRSKEPVHYYVVSK